MTPAQFGFVSSVLTIGGLLGAFLGGTVSSRLGRLKGMLCGAAFYVLGAAGETLAPGVTMMAAGRLLAGIVAGAALTTCPLYIAEMAPPGQKGFFGAMTQVMINVGIIVTQVLGWFLSEGSLWRVILGIGGMIAVGQLLGLLLAGQESPQWLADKGQHAQAMRVLRQIRGPDANIEDEIKHWDKSSVNDEQETLLQRDDRSQSSGKDSTKGLLAVLLDTETRAAVIVVIMVMVSQQMTGINAIMMYGVDLLSGLLSSNSALLSIGVAALNLMVTILVAPLPDKLGRKPCLMSSIAGMGTSSLLMAFAMSNGIAWLSVIAVLLFVASFALGLGPVPFMLATELVGPDAVASTQSWALAANYGSNYLVAQFFPILNQRLGGGNVFLIFAAAAVVFGLYLALSLPETMGKTDIDEIWGRKKAPERVD